MAPHLIVKKLDPPTFSVDHPTSENRSTPPPQIAKKEHCAYCTL